MSESKESLRIVEVGPRDGLQNQTVTLPLDVKQKYIQMLLAAGVKEFEAGAFVRADRVPQMSDSEKILDGVSLGDARAYFLVPNEKGLEKAIGSGVENIAVFTAASETFNQKNVGMTLEKSIEVFENLIPKALKEGLRVRGYVSTVWGCPYEGEVCRENVFKMVGKLLDLGCFEVSLGDTIGVARPAQVRKMLQGLRQQFSVGQLGVHLHDTYGMGVANILVALEEGIRCLDAASGGLGGCPFAPGATGNVGTEDILYLLQGLPFSTTIDLAGMVKASTYIYQALGGGSPASKTLQALCAKVSKGAKH